jgi:hypothetical protein
MIIRVKLSTVVTRRVGPDLVSGRGLSVRLPTRARPDTRSGPTKSAGRIQIYIIGMYTKKNALWNSRLASSPTLPFVVRAPLAFTAPVTAPWHSRCRPDVLAFATLVRADIERQRRSTTKPRVGARHERLPWVPVAHVSNPNGVAQQRAGLVCTNKPAIPQRMKIRTILPAGFIAVSFEKRCVMPIPNEIPILG